MMQIGMALSFVLSYPANVFLVKRGWKEKMPQTRDEMKRKTAKQNFEQQTDFVKGCYCRL